MKCRVIQVRIFRGEHKYVAECLDLAVVTQADTLDELAANSPPDRGWTANSDHRPA
ncbi:MAG TPA: hypothetical protein VMT15_16720 [Bryobacteraceae bacterium]|nr:hypothetical protein [Bryobacteraceae bacterium]